jgi:hypothetical protein
VFAIREYRTWPKVRLKPPDLLMLFKVAGLRRSGRGVFDQRTDGLSRSREVALRPPKGFLRYIFSDIPSVQEPLQRFKGSNPEIRPE